MSENGSFTGWAILELLGHRRLAGYLCEQEIAGAAFLRIDIPSGDGVLASQFYALAAVYGITPTTEEVARAVAQHNQPQPVHRWELPAPRQEVIDAHGIRHDPDDDDLEWDADSRLGEPPF